MPTPVSAARQCLTGDAARALDDAVAVARRRSHAQTTSLHAISALLALPSSTLREACARSRTFASSSAAAAVSSRLQFRALDLSFSVSLDRLPSAHSHPNAAATTASADADPPISNSLMAAIKRSQANQRRNPESFFLQQQQQQQQPSSPASSSPTSNSSSSSSSSALCVKVDLQPLILSILDDPIVSRVFGDAGFRTSDIKLAILRPLTSLRAPRPRCPPLFLCNFTELDAGGRRPGFNFPFSGASAFGGGSSSSCFPDLDENCRRIAEVLARSNRRNPLLVGVCARDALRSFAEYIQRGAEAAFAIPREIVGLKYVCIEEEVGSKGELPGMKLDEQQGVTRRSEPSVFVNASQRLKEKKTPLPCYAAAGSLPIADQIRTTELLICFNIASENSKVFTGCRSLLPRMVIMMTVKASKVPEPRMEKKRATGLDNTTL